MVDSLQLVETRPRYTPLGYGLLSVAQPVPDDGDPHWQHGTLVQVDPCGIPAAITGGPCVISQDPLSKNPSVTGMPLSQAEPFTVMSYIPCSPVGFGDDLAELTRRTDAFLTNGEARAVEGVFWTGVTVNGVIRPHLAEDTPVSGTAHGAQTTQVQTAATVVNPTPGTAVDIVQAMGLLEGALATCYGGEGVIHAPVAAVSHMVDHGLVSARGQQLRTLMGNLVAAYASGNRQGPTGADPAATETWIYATGAVTVHKSALKRRGQVPGEVVGRRDNSTVMLVERTYVLDWDCCHLAAQVSLAGAPTG